MGQHPPCLPPSSTHTCSGSLGAWPPILSATSSCASARHASRGTGTQSGALLTAAPTALNKLAYRSLSAYSAAASRQQPERQAKKWHILAVNMAAAAHNPSPRVLSHNH
jgi:hypothetical protein